MEKLNVGIVGLGRLGKIHAHHLAESIGAFHLYAACSVVDSELDYAKENLGVEKVYRDYGEMLADDAIDAVVLVTPSHQHCGQIIQGLEAGKHVFCEKPLGLELEEMLRVEKAVEEHPNQVFMLGFMRRYDESYMYAKELVDQGEIGDVTLIRCYGIDPNSGMESFIEFCKNSSSGGLFLDMAIHDIDLIRWFTGQEISKVWALGNNIAYPILDELGDTETGAALCKLENNAIGIMVAGRNAAHGYHVETEIIGTKGSLRIANLQEKNLVTILNEHGAVRPMSQNFPERFKGAFLNELTQFAKYINNNQKAPISVKDGIRATQAAIACGESMDSGELVSIEY
ncbi:inositol 2-dehydrogenase [Suicoccus acidiformans]|uniref:Inositol 2-dehydrogenase n=1 Tax=Suicoccus acidiformans TaxID=2036206 RepID=A0A347WIV9_9LACT|nr:inositol 2-dehydrogenase [Suicoccus acidiformans]AXY25016.1 inositol 2-dehydrogenase [Suicoccus acidiformans]